MKDLQKLNLTTGEEEVLTDLISQLYAEPGFTDVSCEDIAHGSIYTLNQVKGYIGSLTKKGIVSTFDNGEYQLVILNEYYYYLHPEWKLEIQ